MHSYFVSYNWVGPNGSGTDWVEAGADGPLDTGQKIHELCWSIVDHHKDELGNQDYASIKPICICLLRVEP